MLAFLLWVFFCVATAMFASIRRHRSGIGWFFVAFFFSPLVAMVLLLILLPREELAPIEPATRPLTIEHQRTMSNGGISDRVMLGMIIATGVIMGFVLITGIMSAASAQQQVIRDSSGRTVVTTTQSGNQTTYRDSGGRTIGTSTLDSAGNSTLRDAGGRTVGTINGVKR